MTGEYESRFAQARYDDAMARLKARDQAAAELASFLAPIVHDAVVAYERAIADAGAEPTQLWHQQPEPRREDTRQLVLALLRDRYLQAPGLYNFAMAELGGLWRDSGSPGVMIRAEATPFHRLPLETRRAFQLVVHVVRALAST